MLKFQTWRNTEHSFPTKSVLFHTFSKSFLSFSSAMHRTVNLANWHRFHITLNYKRLAAALTLYYRSGKQTSRRTMKSTDPHWGIWLRRRVDYFSIIKTHVENNKTMTYLLENVYFTRLQFLVYKTAWQYKVLRKSCILNWQQVPFEPNSERACNYFCYNHLKIVALHL